MSEISPAVHGAVHATEQDNDERMWRVMRQCLLDFGFTNKVAQLDVLWNMSTPSSAWDNIPWQNPLGNAEVIRIAKEVNALHTNDLEVIITKMSPPECNFADTFAGIILWTMQGGKPVVHNLNLTPSVESKVLSPYLQEHLALHFIYGAECEAVAGMGHEGAVTKEELDEEGGGVFNLDEMNASIDGANWVSRHCPRHLAAVAPPPLLH
jgi:hypothetical protein